MPAEEIVGASLPPGVDGDVQGQLCLEVLHAPENLRFRWWGMKDFSTVIPSKRPPLSPYVAHSVRTTPDCFAAYIRDSNPTLEIGRARRSGVLTSINLRPFLRGMDLVVDKAFPVSNGQHVHLRITTFWNLRDVAQSFEKNEQLARDMVDRSMELRGASAASTASTAAARDRGDRSQDSRGKGTSALRDTADTSLELRGKSLHASAASNAQPPTLATSLAASTTTQPPASARMSSGAGRPSTPKGGSSRNSSKHDRVPASRPGSSFHATETNGTDTRVPTSGTLWDSPQSRAANHAVSPSYASSMPVDTPTNRGTNHAVSASRPSNDTQSFQPNHGTTPGIHSCPVPLDSPTNYSGNHELPRSHFTSTAYTFQPKNDPIPNTHASTFPRTPPNHANTVASLQERAQRLQQTMTTDSVEPAVQAQLEDLLASDPMYAVKCTPAVASNARVAPVEGPTAMTLCVEWISLRRGLPQVASAVQLVVDYISEETKDRRTLAQFSGKTLVQPDRVMIQDTQTIMLEGVPPILRVRLVIKQPEAEGELGWGSVSRSRQFMLPLKAYVVPPKKGAPKPPKVPPYGMVSLVCSVDLDHLLVVLHRLDMKKPSRVQLNFKLGPSEEVTTPGFCDELNFATVSQDPVTLDAIVFEVWAFPRADLIGLCKVPIPSAESALRSEIFSWDTGEVIGALELTLRRAPKAHLQPFLTPQAKPRDPDGRGTGAKGDSRGGMAAAWLRAGRSGIGRILAAPAVREMKNPLRGDQLLEMLLDCFQGLARNEAVVLAWTIVRHFQGEVRGLAAAHKTWNEPFDAVSIPGSFVSFWIESRQRLAMETIKRLVPRPSQALIRVLRDKWSYDLGEPTCWTRQAFVSFMQTHCDAPPWDLVEAVFKALDEFGSNEIDAWVFASLVLRHEESIVQMQLAGQSDLLEFVRAIAAKKASVREFFFGFVVNDYYVNTSAFAHVAQSIISEQQASRLADFLATPEGVDIRALEALCATKEELVKNGMATTRSDETNNNNCSGKDTEKASTQDATLAQSRGQNNARMDFVRCGPSSLPSHPGAKALCLDFLAKLVSGEIPMEVARAVLHDAARLVDHGEHIAVAAWQTLSFSTSPETGQIALRAFAEPDTSEPGVLMVREERLREGTAALPLLSSEPDDELQRALRDLEDADGYIRTQDLNDLLARLTGDPKAGTQCSELKQCINSSPRRELSESSWYIATSERWRIPRGRCLDFPPYLTFALLTYPSDGQDTVRGKLFYDFLVSILGLDKVEAGDILESLDATKTSSQVAYVDWRRYIEEVDCIRRQKLAAQQPKSQHALRQQLRQVLDFADKSLSPLLDEALESQGVSRQSEVVCEVFESILTHMRLPPVVASDVLEWASAIFRLRGLPPIRYGDIVAWFSLARAFRRRHLDDFFGALLMAPAGPVDLDILFPASTKVSADEFVCDIRRACGWGSELPRRHEEALQVLECDELRGAFLADIKQMYRNFRHRHGALLRAVQKCMNEHGETTITLFVNKT